MCALIARAVVARKQVDALYALGLGQVCDQLCGSSRLLDDADLLTWWQVQINHKQGVTNFAEKQNLTE